MAVIAQVKALPPTLKVALPSWGLPSLEQQVMQPESYQLFSQEIWMEHLVRFEQQVELLVWVEQL
jgi:hypothetical protein